MLQKYKAKREEGFTIIEVLIVLAIAGLILLIVFLAVPALQRNSRNNARNNEASRLSSTVTDCLANRNGRPDACATPGDLGLVIAGGVMEGYQQFEDVDVSNTNTPTVAPADGEVRPLIRFNLRCNETATEATDTDATGRDFVVLYQAEGAGEDVDRCIGSQ
jgi:prepilin-type N-terminal cleavage/methylation domain-containing protein